MMLSQSYQQNILTAKLDEVTIRPSHSINPDPTAFATISVRSSPSKSLTSSGSQLLSPQANRQALQLAENIVPSSNAGGSQVDPRGAISLQLDPQSRRGEDGSGQHRQSVSASRDGPLRGSKEGRPTSRPSGPAASSPYLQPPGGRSSQGGSHRPNSRQHSQNSPQPQHTSPQHISPQHAGPGVAGGLARTPGSSSSGSGNPSFINGARIMQTYGAPVGKPAPPAHSLGHGKQTSQPLGATGQARPPADHPTQQQPQPRPTQPQPQPQPQPRTTLAQQQQQQAGPRATTAFSGARSMQRARQESGTGGAAAGEPGQGAVRMGAAAANHAGYPHHPGQYGGMVPGHGPIPMAGREAEVNSASFGYDDIPEEMDETSSPLNGYSGLTLDQYMQRMVTTPASAAATSGLGVSADSGEESAPCSPGNASTRTEEDDGPCPSPGRGPGTSLLGLHPPGRSSDAGERDRHLLLLQQQQQQALRGSVSRASGSGASAASGGSPPGVPVRLGSGGRPSGHGAAAAGTGAAGHLGRPGGPLAGGVRSSGTNPATFGRGSTGTCAQEGFLGGGGSGGGGIDVSSLMADEDSSDDEQHNPAALINSPRTARHLSSRASAMAFSNSLDLRPATAAVVSSPSMTRGDPGAARHGMAMNLGADSGNHHAIIKQVDLGGLSASLFTPNNPNGGRESSSPATAAASSLANAAAANATDLLGPSNPSSPDMATVAAARGDRRAAAAAANAAGGAATAVATVLRGPGPTGSEVSGGGGCVPGTPKALASPKTPMSAIPPPWGVSAREGAFGSGPAGDGAAGSGSLQALAARPLSSRGRPGAAGVGGGADVGAASSPSGAAAGAAAAAGSGRPGSGMKWAKTQQAQKPADGGPVDLPPEARLLAAEAQSMARPPTRQVQSARPPGARGEVELDPSVWQANIAMQLQRPPSRQKPPPEALHLWTPEQQMSMLAAGSLGRSGGGRPLGGRPQSAAPTTYRSSRPTSGPSVRAHGPVGDDVAGSVARPPSRQKPPPLSTLLEHDDFPPPPPAGSRRPRPGADQLDVVVSGSSDEEDDDDLD